MSHAPGFTLHEELLNSTLREIFGDIDPDFMAQIRPRITTLELPGGSVLMRQGDASDAIYMVLSGRLRATLVDAEQRTVLLGEIGRGEPIGEMGVISGESRGATVTALRDCVLLRLSAPDFTDLLQSWPKVALPLARKLIERLSHSNQRQAAQKHVVNICLLPLHADLDAHALGRQLLDNLRRQLQRSRADNANFPLTLITRQHMEQALGPGRADSEPTQVATDHELLVWLDAQEMQHDMQVFIADPCDSAWTRLCLRHADHILLLADADGDARLTEVEQNHLAGPAPLSPVTQSLWLLHPDACQIPTRTDRWLQARPHIPLNGLSHFHTRRQHDGDWGRLARILTGQATGLVLAGGGARGFAHLGILEVLEDNGIEWDLVGGTSIGSVMAAYAAMDLPIQDVIALAAQAFSSNPTGDLNWLPFMSIMRGRRLAGVIQSAVCQALGTPVQIEDLWKPYFCVASNYSRAQAQVLRNGDLARCITASVSIPAALPPVLWQGDLLTDGGTFNNYPVDVMRESGATRVIGVDLSRDNYRPLPYEHLPSNLALFIDRFLRPPKRRRYKGLPSLPTIVFNVAAMASRSHEQRMRAQVDLAFTPDVSRIGMLEWNAFDKVVDIGRRHAQERLQGQAQVFEAGWFASQYLRPTQGDWPE